MPAAWKIAGKVLLWVGIVVLVIMAGIGLMLLDKVIPQKSPLSFYFAGWTNDAQGTRAALLCASNHSAEAVMYMGDRNRNVRCEVISVFSQHGDGRHYHIVYTNLADHHWTGHVPVQLAPRSTVECVLPWRDEYTNGTATLSYLPQPNFIKRIYEKISFIFTRQNVQMWHSVPLTGAPWTNSAVPGLQAF